MSTLEEIQVKREQARQLIAVKRAESALSKALRKGDVSEAEKISTNLKTLVDTIVNAAKTAKEKAG